MEDDGAGPGPQPNSMTLTRFEVEIDGLAAFAAYMERELGENVRPSVDGIQMDMPEGWQWGRHIRSDAIRHARRLYLDADHSSMASLTRFMTSAEVMIEVVRRLMETYRTSDEMASLTLPQVQNLISSVHKEIRAGDAAAPSHGFQEGL